MDDELDLFEKLVEAKRRGRSVALATVVATHGSSPRKAGAMMLIRSDGSIAGTIGGGVLEALVIGEAMARGLPVIATPNSGAQELVRDGIESFIVPIRNSDAIVDKLTLLYEDECQRRVMADAAKRRAAEMSWALFEDRVTCLVRELVA